MCDSDDTDTLLLIPPDYFVVFSSDDSVRNTPRLPASTQRRMEPFQSTALNKLMSQVNTLQNRLSVIEHQSESVESTPIKQRNKPAKNRRVPKFRGRLSLSNDNLKSRIISPHGTPKKSPRRAKMYSLPSSPSGTTTEFEDVLNNASNQKQNFPNLATRYDPSGNSIDSLNVSFSPPKKRGSNLTLREIDERYKSEPQEAKFIESDEDDVSELESLNLHENKAILNEIQTFLRCVDCIKSHINGKESPDSSIDLSFITSPQFKAIAQRHFNRKVLTSGVKRGEMKKTKKPTVSQLQQFLEDSKISSQNSHLPAGDNSNITANSTISLMNSNDPEETTFHGHKNDCADLRKNISIQVLLEPKNFTNSQSDNLITDSSSKSVDDLQEQQETAARILNEHNQIKDGEKKSTKSKFMKESSVIQAHLEKPQETDDKENVRNRNEAVMDPDFQENLRQWHLLLPKLQQHFNKTKDEQKSDAAVSIPHSALVSLSSLWNMQDTAKNQDINVTASNVVPINQKIEEERYRREHCEHLIKALQIRLLESQEKLTVALKVDAAKDQALEKLKDTCLVAQERCKQVELDKDSALQELRDIQKRLQAESEDTHKKIKYYEHEIAKALDVAHASQNEAKHLQNQMDDLKKDLEKSITENIKLCEQVKQLQSDVHADKQLMAEIRNAASETKNIVTSSQSEIMRLQEERQSLQRKLSEEKIKISQLESAAKTVKQLLDESKQNEKKLTLEKQNLMIEMDRAKTELRAFYQRQVETLVKDKRDEYQAQLDAVEKTCEERISAEKLEVAKTAAQFMRETVEKHRLEIRLLEERHKEEIKLFDIKRQQSEQTIQSLTNKLQRQQFSRAKLASKLHDLIESQWREALRIVTANGGSPFGGSDLSLVKQDSTANIQKLLDLNMGDECLRTESDSKLSLRRSHNIRPNSAPDELPTSDKSKTTCYPIAKPDLMSMRRMRQETPSSYASEHSDIPFGNDDQTTYRSMNPSVRVESDGTPLTTRLSQNNSRNPYCDGELQTYMKMLLEKTESSTSSVTCFSQRDPASGDYKAGAKVINDNFNSSKACKDSKMAKRPWK